MPSETAVVTGATGFIAIELIKQLLQKGYHVKGTHRASADPSRLADVTALARGAPGSLELVQADLLKPGAFDSIVKGVLLHHPQNTLADQGHVCHARAGRPPQTHPHLILAR